MRILLAVDLSFPNHDWLTQRSDEFAHRMGGVLDVLYVRKTDASLADIDYFDNRLSAILNQVSPDRRGRARLEV